MENELTLTNENKSMLTNENESLLATEDEFMLTTIDNPFDPFEQFTNWFLFDVEKGYNTCSYLARISRTSDEFSEQENNKEIERAIDEIIKYDFMGIYKKVKRNSKNNQSLSINNSSIEIEDDDITI